MVDLSPHLGPAGDQGNRGTCVAFAATAAHELARKARRSQPHEPLSVESLYWSAKQVEGDNEPGIYVDSARTALRSPGQCAAAAWPYDSAHDEKIALPGPPGSAMPLPTFRASVTPIGVEAASILAELQMSHAVVVLLDLWDAWFSYREGDIASPEKNDLLGEYHAVAVVGFDAARAGFLVRNSWGRGWGTEGHCWLPLGALSIAGLEAYAVHDDVDR
jgi:C1A family cysteine protease